MTARLDLLGRIAVHGADAATPGILHGRRAELVFAYLAAEHRRVVSQDELADALWPEKLPDSWAAALRGVISEVRRYLEESGLPPADFLATARRGYQFLLPAGVVVDLDEARDALARARALLEAGDGPGAIAQAVRSAALARLPFLPNHEGDWVDGIRRELESIHARALEIETHGHRAAGDVVTAARAAEHLVRAEPFNEAAHQLRIRLLGEAGDRAGAIRAYEHCRSTLADELGVEPSADTEAALQAAVRPQATPAGPVARSTATDPGPLGDLSVLVIEDHDFQRRTAVRLLRGLGVGSVSDAENGAVALEILAGPVQPDVIVCDIDMPGMDGIQFIGRVAERELASAVVIASGLDSKVLEAVKAVGEAHGLQVLGALEKPLTPRRLGELLATYRRPPARLSPAGEAQLSREEVAAALASGQTTTLFEPSVDLTECRVSGAEALGCWSHPAGGHIPPAVFLSALAAEGRLRRHVEDTLADACAGVRRSEASGLALSVGVDLDPRTLGDVALADRFLDTVQAAGAEASQVTFEVTAHALSVAPSIALDVMTRLRVKGFGLALDQLGTRRPPADRLAHIPFTEVKIDSSLVAGVTADRQRLGLLEEVFDFAQSLRIPVTATGCDSEADFDLVVDMGCRYAQGPCIGPPMTAHELVAWAGTWTPPVPDGGEPR